MVFVILRRGTVIKRLQCIERMTQTALAEGDQMLPSRVPRPTGRSYPTNVRRLPPQRAGSSLAAYENFHPRR